MYGRINKGRAPYRYDVIGIVAPLDARARSFAYAERRRPADRRPTAIQKKQTKPYNHLYTFFALFNIVIAPTNA